MAVSSPKPAPNYAARRWLKRVESNMRTRAEGENYRQETRSRRISDDEWEQLEETYKELKQWREDVEQRSSTWIGGLVALPSIRALLNYSKAYVKQVRRTCDTVKDVDDAVPQAFAGRYHREDVMTSIAALANDDSLQLCNTLLALAFTEDTAASFKHKLRITLDWPDLVNVVKDFPDRFLRFTLDLLQDTIDRFDEEVNKVSDGQDNEDLLRMKCAKVVRRIVHVTGDIPPSLIIMGVDSKSSFAATVGGCGAIYKGKLRGRMVAVKVLHYDATSSEDDKRQKLRQLYREAIIWRHLHHRNIHKLLGVHEYAGRHGMVSYWCDKGNLPTYIRSCHGKCDRIYMLERISDALCYLHGSYCPALVHKDIKGENILVDDEGEPCLTDFGISTYYQSFTVSAESGNSGTPAYMAPEILELRLQYDAGMTDEDELNMKVRKTISTAYDIYAFACVCIEVYSENKLWQGTIWTDLGVINGQRPPRPAGEMPDELWSMIQKCWVKQPGERMKTQAVREALVAMRHAQSSELC